MAAAHILVADDEPDIRNLVKEILEDEGYEVTTAESGEAARQARRQRRPDMILLDIWMPDIDGISLLREWSEAGQLPCPVIMISGHGTVETAVEATRLGAYDFIEKPLSLAKLLVTVERALESHNLKKENEGLKRQVHQIVEPTGKSAEVQEVKEQAKRIAQHDSWVLISGETGTGKEIVARYIHHLSGRRDGPFVEMNAGAFAREDSSRELFGSEQDGQIRYGRLEQANGGILFINEVGNLDFDTQVQLSGALESGSFRRLGGSEPAKIDVRVVATSARNLEQESKNGRFYEPLFYQLNVLPLRVPPLREHREDVPDLLNAAVDQLVDQDNLPYRRFSVAAQNRLRNYAWPGNVRELKNLVQRVLILGSGEEIGLAEIESTLGAQAEAVPEGAGEFDMPLREAREQFERRYLTHQLVRCEGSVSKLAKAVGMERTHLYRKLRALGIDPKTAKTEAR
ncbi:MAG: sigma-54-dependent Fis family transcriptional regulator [Gammaproteobacteria bacterium]|nr:MAG: sigma-54-dependent Fis family transcriptional regulator [Gammaproteobacteria bacterium]